MKRSISLLILLVLLLPLTADAFDGARKGFVLGGGLGIAPTATWEVKNLNLDESKGGLALHFIIGYAFDNTNMIVYEGNVVGYQSDLVKDETIAQGFNGLSLYHYFGDGDQHAFLVGGLGFYVFDPESFDQNDPGFGLLLGAGYEFVRHLQIGAYVSAGNTSDPQLPIDYEHTHFSLMISAVAF